MKLDQLRRMALFAMVAKEGSFTAVSKQQQIATSAISSAISQLEAGLGVRLLNRTTRVLKLTVEGEGFLKRCEAMLFEAQAAHEEVKQDHKELTGTLTITAAHLEAQTWLLPALKPLFYLHPKLTPKLIITDGFVNLIESGIDIAIRSSGDLTDSSLVARSLTTTGLKDVLVATPQHLAKHGLPQQAQDLSAHTIVAFSSFGQPQTVQLTDSEGKSHKVKLKLGAQADNLFAVKELCMMHMGMARVPLELVQHEIASGALQIVLPDHTLPHYKTYAVTTKRTLESPKISAVIQVLQDYFKCRP